MAMTQRPRSALPALFLSLVLLLALALRFYRIEAQSLWYDEGNSARLVERPVRLIIEGAAGDIHPPLYYLLLKLWRAAFGEGEAALRALSAVCSALTVLFAYLIGRTFSQRTGGLAAFLLASMPFAIYYAQEARMYALLALCAAISTWAILAWRDRPERTNLAASVYVLATAAGLWTHYAYPFVMFAQGVAFAAWLVSRRALVALARYAAFTIAALGLYLPWLPIALRQAANWGVERASHALSDAVVEIYRTLVVGTTLPTAEAGLPMALFGTALGVGLIVPDRASLHPRALMAALLALPAALLLMLGLYREAYLKFLLVSALPLCVLVARGCDITATWAVQRLRRPRWAAPIAAGLVVLLLASVTPSLNNLYHNPTYARDDYRGIQRLIAADRRPDDAVLFLAPNQWEVFTYYQRDDRNLYPLTYRPASYQVVDRQMRAIAATHSRLFALYFGERDADPEGWYETWMSEQLYKAHERWVGNVRLAVYDSGRDSAAWTAIQGATFGPAIVLRQVRGRFGLLRQGDVLPVELIWEATAPPMARYKVFIHIGPADGPPIAQHDSEPVAGYRPTDGWTTGERIHDRRGAWIAPGTPAGDYGVFVGLYDPHTGARLMASRDGQTLGDRLLIGTVRVR
jgi:mannosyltransferase